MSYEWSHVTEPHRQQWVLKRNCALTPVQLAAAVGGVGLVSVVVAIVCACFGAWPVIPFAGLEMAALLVAFVVHGRHAGDYERIVVSPEAVIVESVDADRIVRQSLRPEWLRVEYRQEDLKGGRQLIRLVSGRQELAVGRFVPADRRALLARQLRASLSVASG